MEKVCTKCNISKDIQKFYTDNTKIDKKRPSCKECDKVVGLKYRTENYGIFRLKRNYYERFMYRKNPQKYRDRKNKQRAIHKDEYNERQNLRYKKDPELRKKKGIIAKKYRKNKENRSRGYQLLKQRKASNPLLRLSHNIRTKIQFSLKRIGHTKNKKTNDLLGGSFVFVRKHLERQFKKGMSWHNYGRGENKWHVDHKIPLASAKTKEDLIKLFHYTNLQPLWQHENLAKHDKILPIQTSLTF